MSESGAITYYNVTEVISQTIRAEASRLLAHAAGSFNTSVLIKTGMYVSRLQ